MSDAEVDIVHPLRRIRDIQDWNSALDKSIADAEQRGEFTNLAGHGKPLQFAANPLTGEIDVGMGLLKGAGYAPAWIELDKEIRSLLDRLTESRTKAAHTLARLAADSHPEHAPTPPKRSSWWNTLRHGTRGNRTDAARVTPPLDRATVYAQSLAQYLEQAKEVDTKIASFNSSIPRELWHLERPRLSPEHAKRDFVEAVGAGEAVEQGRQVPPDQPPS